MGWYDYGARMYNPNVGRWNGVDALAEEYAGWSPFTYVLGNPLRFIDPDGNKIVVPNENDRRLVLSYVHSVWGENTFTYDKSSNELKFVGSKKGMTRLQKKALKTFEEALNAPYNIMVKLSNFNEKESESLDPEKNPLVVSEGGAHTDIAIDGNDEVIAAVVLMDPNKLTDLALWERMYVYLDGNNQLQTASTCPEGENCGLSHRAILKDDGSAETAPKSPVATFFHEIAHPINEGKDQRRVLAFDNLIRRIIGIQERSPSDPEHNEDTN